MKKIVSMLYASTIACVLTTLVFAGGKEDLEVIQRQQDMELLAIMHSYMWNADKASNKDYCKSMVEALEKGSDPLARSGIGYCPIHYIVNRGDKIGDRNQESLSLDMLNKLMGYVSKEKRSEYINSKTLKGNRPIDLARLNGNHIYDSFPFENYMFVALLKLGADPNGRKLDFTEEKMLFVDSEILEALQFGFNRGKSLRGLKGEEFEGETEERNKRKKICLYRLFLEFSGKETINPNWMTTLEEKQIEALKFGLKCGKRF